MKRINLLSQSVYNRIAAGEVVDRPYSVVKELIENSIDSGATEIEIKIEKGGKQLIEVTDNGSGIYKDDLPSAFMPHATSKISRAEDLDNISTLGFRGEALASISAVSKAEIISATEQANAYCITCDGGVIGEITPAAFEKGTRVTVRNLFYNTPVRAKFLKTDKKEETDITNFVSRYILCNISVKFKYYVDGKLSLQSYGGGLDEAIAQVYGAKVLPQCIKLDAVKEDIHIYGYIGNQNFFKPNKSYQSTFINGRYIVNNTVSTAISNAYSAYAMKRQFPFYVLNIDMPKEMVDVNVHPSKADVRFADNRAVFSAIYKIISSVLDGTASAAEFVVNNNVRVPEIRSSAPKNAEVSASQPNESKGAIDELIQKYKPRPYSGSPEDIKVKEEEPKKDEAEDDCGYFNPEFDMPLHQYYGLEEQLKKYQMPMELDSEPEIGVADCAMQPLPPEQEKIRRIHEDIEKRLQESIEYDTCTFCGTVFNTYLIYEYHKTLFFIDQHAAHERLLYDKLVAKIKARKIVSQPLLYPYLLDLNAEESNFIQENMASLEEMGFKISPFGTDVYRVYEIPADLSDLNIKEFFNELLGDLNGLKQIKLEQILKEKLASTACKHAIKGGKKLTDREINKLFKMLNGNVGLKCPHGRPVCVALSKRDIEKMFKRIV